MSNADPLNPLQPRSVFLSYASQDRPAAQLLRDALPGFGLEVWYDESDLTGGDAWDQKIRRQIRECDFFMPVISATTEARHEGYFRREWRLAVERTLDMADDHTFLLPVVIDDTQQTGARVPERFLTVQWSRVPGGQPTPAFEALCRRLAAGEAAQQASPRAGKRAPPLQAAAPMAPLEAARQYPDFPKEEPGQKTRFWFQVMAWALQCAWATFKRLPRWIRWLIYAWVIVIALQRGCSSGGHRIGRVEGSDEDVSPATKHRVEEIAKRYQGSKNPADIVNLGTQIAREIAKDGPDKPTSGSELLVVPFATPADDSAAQRVVDSTFAQVYGRIAVSHRGHVGLAPQPLVSLDPAAAAERGRDNHSSYVLYGAIDNQPGAQNLSIRIVKVKDGAVVWSQSYPVASADAMKIATEVDSKVPDLSDE